MQLSLGSQVDLRKDDEKSFNIQRVNYDSYKPVVADTYKPVMPDSFKPAEPYKPVISSDVPIIGSGLI